MKAYYASLQGPLCGLFYPLPLPDTFSLRTAQMVGGIMLNSSRKMKAVWCAIYSAEETQRQAKEYDCLILPDGFAERLDYDSHEVDQFCVQHEIEL